MKDLVYFNSKCAPGDTDWMRCDILSTANGMLRVRVTYGSPNNKQDYEFPMTSVRRIERGERW